MGKTRPDGRATLTAIAAGQRPAVECAPDKPLRPLIEHDHLIDVLGPFVRASLDKKDLEKTLGAAGDVLADMVGPLFAQACTDAGVLHTAADLAGGTWVDPVEGTELEIFEGEVQWQHALTTKDLEVGSKAEKAMTAEARRMCPEAVKLELTVDLMTPAEADALVAELGAERIARLFKVTHVRRCPTNEELRELYTKKGTRKVLEALQACGAVKVKQFAKIVPKNRGSEG